MQRLHIVLQTAPRARAGEGQQMSAAGTSKPAKAARFITSWPESHRAARWWSCRWLVNDDTAELSRPDRSHYVLDIIPDFITLTDNDDPDKRPSNVQIIQVWVDPKYPDAHRDPALRDYLKRRGEEGIAALIRYSARDAFVLFPPAMTGSGEFVEHRTGMRAADHTAAEIVAGIAQAEKVKIG